MDIVDLKEEPSFIEEYIGLRNSWSELLLTSPVSVAETREWLKGRDIEIRGLVEDNILLGAVILYLNRDGEIAFFAKEKNRGIGRKLLRIIEEVAEKREAKSIWGWVLRDNSIAQRVFEKNGFLKEGVSERLYNGAIKQGYTYRKYLKY